MEKTQNRPQTIYGLRPVIEAVESGAQIERVWIQNGLNGTLVGELRRALKEKGVPAQYVPQERIEKLASGNHQGVVAVVSKVKYHSMADILESAGENALIVMLDRVTDVRNMGAIARTAECTGAAALVVPDHGSAALNEDAIKTSSGALLRLPVCREQNLKTAINLAKQYGFQVVASTEKGTIHYRDVDFRRPTLLIMGNEEAGIGSDLLRLCDVKARLPIAGSVASLNVSVAAGVMMYEAFEQRNRQ
ncbi:MAG: 23S rRNA (guanosine(2251)-2'-O)-methyltransferase RlmB [Bacteroidales bacterium]|nr:23S rRNA (guanosine(2251)-2'-O)-methyltransferase RlmB [Bacteroidales bacterium]